MNFLDPSSPFMQEWWWFQPIVIGTVCFLSAAILLAAWTIVWVLGWVQSMLARRRF